jgi:hypothetical protein
MVEQVLPVEVGWGGTSGMGEDVGRGYRRVNMVQILFTHVYKWKNDACCNYFSNGRREG